MIEDICVFKISLIKLEPTIIETEEFKQLSPSKRMDIIQDTLHELDKLFMKTNQEYWK